jgi:hypothetical protein
MSNTRTFSYHSLEQVFLLCEDTALIHRFFPVIILTAACRNDMIINVLSELCIERKTTPENFFEKFPKKVLQPEITVRLYKRRTDLDYKNKGGCV